jgi:transposase InsO family protein
VCTENLNPDVMVMKSAEDWMRFDISSPLNGEIFYSLKEGQIVIEQWRKHYNTIRPHSSLGYRPPAPQTMNPFLTPLDQAAQMQ